MNALATDSVTARRPSAAADPAPPRSRSWPSWSSHRPYLVRFALRKLHDPALAEDAVHDVVRGRALRPRRASAAARRCAPG